MSYYTTIEGKKLDKRLIELAETAIAGQGDGRISTEDATKIIEAVKDGGIYTEIEKDTMEYIRDHFKWTDAADDWFRSQIASWAASKA
ncbi:MAG: hypothetical protein AB7O48_17650 [Cyclobacteriaceae bacterium]